MAFRNFIQDLDTAGDGTGSTNGAQNFAVPTDFMITFNTKHVTIDTFAVAISDDAAFTNATNYGAGAAVTNGVLVTYRSKDVATYNLFGNKVMTQNRHWVESMDESSLVDWKNKDSTLVSVVKFITPISLTQAGDFFKVTLRDNFTFLVSQTFTVSGMMEV